MTDRVPSDTLAAALPREMVRVARMACEFRMFGSQRFLASVLMDVAVDRGQRAIETGDAIEMLLAYEHLKGFTW